MNKFLTSGPVTEDQIAGLLTELSNPDTGGHSVFLGQVRADLINGIKVKAIEYSAYESMVNAEGRKIIEEVSQDFPDVSSVKIVHSTGLVPVGKYSLAVFVSAGHRHEAIEACRVTVEKIKEKLPVWKKEIFEDDSVAWRENN